MARMSHEPWDCPHCWRRSYVKVYSRSCHQWHRANPPRYCPCCGKEIHGDDGYGARAHGSDVHRGGEGG